MIRKKLSSGFGCQLSVGRFLAGAVRITSPPLPHRERAGVRVKTFLSLGPRALHLHVAPPPK